MFHVLFSTSTRFRFWFLSGRYQLDLCQAFLSRRDALQLHTQGLASART